jgi:hypothetical protein
MDKQRWRISLRDAFWLILWVAVLLATWRLTDPSATKICINHHNSDAAIRQQLLSHTPKGTPAVDVLEFVMAKLDHENYVDAYSEYVDTLESRTGKRSGAIRTTASIYTGNSISAIVSERAAGFFLSELIVAYWHFDDQDRVAGITIDRHCLGP